MPPLVQAMAWRRIGDKPLPEQTMAQSTDTYITRPYWVNPAFNRILAADDLATEGHRPLAAMQMASPLGIF